VIQYQENLKPTIQIDNNLSNIKDYSNYTCSILIGRNYLSYALSNKENSIIYLLKHYYFEDKVIGKNDFNEILSDPVFKNVNNVKIAIDTLKSTLVPKILYAKEHIQDYYQFVHELNDEESLFTQEISQDKISIYSLKKSTVGFLGSIYKNVTFYDASSCILNNYPSLTAGDNSYTAFIIIKDDCASLSFYLKKDLILHKILADVSITDITYHIANFIEVQKISKDKMSIQLFGESIRVPIVYNELIQYFPSVKYGNRIGNLQYPETLFDQPTHYFFNLFSLVTCA